MANRYGSRNYALDHKPDAGYLWVNCWCERGVFLIREHLVGTLTQCCGRPGCQPPKENQ